MSTTLKRYNSIRRSDDVDDQQNSLAIVGAIASSITQEEFQTFFLSRLRQAIWGESSPDHWYDDFFARGGESLWSLLLNFLLENEPSSVGNTYAITRIGTKVTKETWVSVPTTLTIKTIDYVYLGNLVSQEIHKVYSPLDGTTVLAQTTTTYSYSVNNVVGATLTRDI